MFKRSKIKIVAAIMSILILLWVGTLGVIYASSYLDLSQRNQHMLQTHAAMYHLPDRPTPPPMAPLPERDEPAFMLSTFYTVAMEYDGTVLQINNGQGVHSDQQLTELARRILQEDKNSGTTQQMIFAKTDKGGYILVTFMDNALLYESMTTLFRYTLVFGSVALIAFFFLAMFLAHKIVQPLEQSYQKQKQFISDAGHELKTPISVISANADLLSRELGDNPWLNNIHYENQRMATLVAQLLDLTRTEQNTLQTEPLDFSHLVQGEVLPFESVAFEQHITLEYALDEGICVHGNADRLRQLVSILTDNAISHGDGPTVYVYLRQERGAARLQVINHGPVLSPQTCAHLFDRFYRDDPARSNGTHYGLGLAIAKAIAEAHKGQLEVRCYDGLVEFSFRLPTQ